MTPVRVLAVERANVSLLIAIGKFPKYVAEQAGHASAGFTLGRHGHLFESMTATPAEWSEDLLWPSGEFTIKASEGVPHGADLVHSALG